MSFRILSIIYLAASATHVHASCAYGTSLHKRAEDGTVPVNTFGYTGVIGPLNWLSLDPAANIACASGTNQSPIDMVEGQFTLVPAAQAQLQLPDIAEAEFENLGTTVEVLVPPGGTVAVDGVAFEMKQFHFHLPSEHLDNGTSIAMEMHMVFESANREIAVVGVYVDTVNGVAPPAGPAAAAPVASAPVASVPVASASVAPTPVASAPAAAAPVAVERRHARDTRAARCAVNVSADEVVPAPAAPIAEAPVAAAVPATAAMALFDTIFASAGQIATPGTTTKIGPLVMSDLLASLNAGQFQAYSGSLTTPPCSEGVRWMVSTQKQAISLQSFDAARQVIGFNARFPQNGLGQENLLSVASNAPAAAVPADAIPPMVGVGEAAASSHILPAVAVDAMAV